VATTVDRCRGDQVYHDGTASTSRDPLATIPNATDASALPSEPTITPPSGMHPRGERCGGGGPFAGLDHQREELGHLEDEMRIAP